MKAGGRNGRILCRLLRGYYEISRITAAADDDDPSAIPVLSLSYSFPERRIVRACQSRGSRICSSRWNSRGSLAIDVSGNDGR